MAEHKVYFIVDLTIHEGKFDRFEDVVQRMVAGSRQEPGNLGYDWHLSGDRKRCRLVEIYADADAVLAHVLGPVVQEQVPKLLENSDMTGFQVLGDPGPKAAELLKAVGAEILARWRGFDS